MYDNDSACIKSAFFALCDSNQSYLLSCLAVLLLCAAAATAIVSGWELAMFGLGYFNQTATTAKQMNTFSNSIKDAMCCGCECIGPTRMIYLCLSAYAFVCFVYGIAGMSWLQDNDADCYSSPFFVECKGADYLIAVNSALMLAGSGTALIYFVYELLAHDLCFTPPKEKADATAEEQETGLMA
jgi:hypothetical protein